MDHFKRRLGFYDRQSYSNSNTSFSDTTKGDLKTGLKWGLFLIGRPRAMPGMVDAFPQSQTCFSEVRLFFANVQNQFILETDISEPYLHTVDFHLSTCSIDVDRLIVSLVCAIIFCFCFNMCGFLFCLHYYICVYICVVFSFVCIIIYCFVFIYSMCSFDYLLFIVLVFVLIYAWLSASFKWQVCFNKDETSTSTFAPHMTKQHHNHSTQVSISKSVPFLLCLFCSWHWRRKKFFLSAPIFCSFG